MKKIIAITLFISAALCYTQLLAQKPAVMTSNEPGWHHVGHTSASFKMQNESIKVLGADEFSAIKIKVSEAPLHIERLQVFYESGDMEEIDVREHFGNGNESRAINLKHPSKDIAKVAFTYKTEANAKGEKADIDLYGLKTNQPAGKDSYKDERDEAREEARETKDEIKGEAREAGDEVEKDAQSVGDKVEEGTKDAAAAITDQKLKNKVGPGGETAYVDESRKYYYISNSGEKVFINQTQLQDKPDND